MLAASVSCHLREVKSNETHCTNILHGTKTVNVSSGRKRKVVSLNVFAKVEQKATSHRRLMLTEARSLSLVVWTKMLDEDVKSSRPKCS